MLDKKLRDRISAVVWLVIAIGICFGSIKLSLGNLHKPGPGFFSFLAGGVLGILSLAVFLQSFKMPSGEGRRAFWSEHQKGLKMIYTVIALIIYVIGINYLGFFVSTLFFTAFLLRVIEPQRWTVVFAVSILTAIISYGVFKYWLDVQLPEGILGF